MGGLGGAQRIDRRSAEIEGILELQLDDLFDLTADGSALVLLPDALAYRVEGRKESLGSAAGNVLAGDIGGELRRAKLRVVLERRFDRLVERDRQHVERGARLS